MTRPSDVSADHAGTGSQERRKINFVNRRLGLSSFALSALVLSAILIASAVAIWVSWLNDNAVLRDKAIAVNNGLTTVSAKIIAINQWVYRNQGFAPNKRYFLIPALGPTPVQVLQSGGECEDKSRLVSAMLRQLGIDSGLVQIFPCEDCGPIHTVVEAEYGSGRMVVDPTWNIEYPSGNGEFLGVQDLAGSSIGREHIHDLQARRGAGDKIQFMSEAEATFDYARAVNWRKNAVSRAAAFGLRILGYTPEQMLRPHFLEDPKLALTLFFLASAAALVVVDYMLFLALAGPFRRLRAAFRLRVSNGRVITVHDKPD